MSLFGGDRSVKVGLSLDPKGYLAGLSASAKATKDWAKAADKSLAKHRRSWEDIGGAATKAGLVIGAGAAAAIVSFARFDQSMSRAAAGTMATRAELDKLRAAALKAGADTQYSATEAADAITAMGKAGIGTNDILGGGLTGALSLAAAGELDVADAAEIAATAMTQFGLSGGQLPHVADLLAAGAGKAQGSVADLAGALKYVGPVAKASNVSIEETVGVLAEFASQGIISEQAGTSLRGVFSSLLSPSKKGAATLDAYGVSLYDANGRFVGLAGAAQQLQEAFGGLTQQQRDAALGTIFGNEQITAATILMQGGGRAVADWTKKVNDSGYASRQAGMLMDNLSGDVEQLKGSLETALISGGGGANQGLRQLTQGATSAVNTFMRLPAPVQHGIVLVASLTSGALLLTAGIIKGALAIKAMRTNLSELGVTGTRTKAVLGGVGKAAAAFGTFELAAAGLGALEKDIADTTVRAGALQEALANLQKGQKGKGELGSLGPGFSDLGKQLKDLSDPSIGRRWQDIDSTISGIVTFGQFGDTAGSADRRQVLADLGQLDEQLASMVSGGKADQAKALFDKLDAGARAGGAGVGQLASQLPAFQDALKGAGSALDDASGSSKDMASGLDKAGVKAKALAQNLTDVRKAAKDLNDAFLSQRSSAREYQQAIDDAADLLAQRGKAEQRIVEAHKDLRAAKTPSQRKAAQKELDEARDAQKGLAAGMDITTEAGRKNQAALDAIAAAAQKQADDLLAAGGSDADYRASLTKSREELRKMARQFGLSAGDAQKLIDTLLRMPEKTAADVEVTGISKALSDLNSLTGVLAIINGKRAVIAASVTSGNVREDRSTLAPKGGLLVAGVTAGAKVGTLPRRAAGGPVRAGMDYWVGEHGPERFRPSLNGMVLSHQASMAPRVVAVPVQAKHERNVNLNGPITVVSPTPSRFTNWASTQQGFGSGGVG